MTTCFAPFSTLISAELLDGVSLFYFFVEVVVTVLDYLSNNYIYYKNPNKRNVLKHLNELFTFAVLIVGLYISSLGSNFYLSGGIVKYSVDSFLGVGTSHE